MQLTIKLNNLDNAKVLNLCAGKTPQLVLNASKIMLDTLIRLYYARHSFEFYDPWIALASSTISNMVIADLAT